MKVRICVLKFYKQSYMWFKRKVVIHLSWFDFSTLILFTWVMKKCFIFLLPIPLIFASLFYYNGLFGIHWGGEMQMIFPKIFLPFPIKYCNTAYIYQQCEINMGNVLLNFLYWLMVSATYLFLNMKYKYNIKSALIAAIIIALLPILWLFIRNNIFYRL